MNAQRDRERAQRLALEARIRAWRLDPNAILSAFGGALARERAMRGLSQRGFAREVGTSPDQIADLERGAGNPTLRTLARLAHALYLRPGELLARVEAGAGAGPPKPPDSPPFSNGEPEGSSPASPS